MRAYARTWARNCLTRPWPEPDQNRRLRRSTNGAPGGRSSRNAASVFAGSIGVTGAAGPSAPASPAGIDAEAQLRAGLDRNPRPGEISEADARHLGTAAPLGQQRGGEDAASATETIITAPRRITALLPLLKNAVPVAWPGAI